jgi:hypothetical protein
MWKAGRFHGKGVYIWQDGRRYEGMTDQAYSRSVHSTSSKAPFLVNFEMSSLSSSIGEWEKGERCGQGTFLLDNGEKHEGTYQVGTAHRIRQRTIINNNRSTLYTLPCSPLWLISLTYAPVHT